MILRNKIETKSMKQWYMSVKQQASFCTGLKSDLTTSRKSDHMWLLLFVTIQNSIYSNQLIFFYKIKSKLLTVQEKI